MTTVINFFFNYSKPLDVLAADINENLACNLEPYEGNSKDYFTNLLGLEFSLNTAGNYDDVVDIDFSNFAYNLSFKSNSASAIQLYAMLIVIHSLYRRLGVTGILVYEVEPLLARYEEKNNKLYEVLSGRYYDRVSEQIADIQKRLPERERELLI